MTNVMLIELLIWPLFLGTLDTGEHIGLCHRCGRPVRLATAGHSRMINAAEVITRIVCPECAEFYPLPAPIPDTDPRAGDGCVCSRPVPCPCGRGCFLCGGNLPGPAPVPPGTG
jgi:hypothetical protein